jgi:hypothetical protein
MDRRERWERFSIASTLDLVEAAIAKHGLMRDQNLVEMNVPIELVVEHFKAGRPRVGQYAERGPSQLRDDITRVTDICARLITERDSLLEKKRTAEIAAGSRETWVQILSVVAGTELIVIGFLLTHLFARLQ